MTRVPQSQLPSLFLISDAARVGKARFLEILQEAQAAGLRALQVREPRWDEARLRELLEVVLEMAPPGFVTLVNRRTELARTLGVGVHIGGGETADVRAARRSLGAEALVGYSAHSLAELDEAEARGASYAFYSPIYTPLSKRSALPPLGLGRLREACQAVRLPVYALGGVQPGHVAGVRAAGAAGVGVIGGIVDARDPARATRDFLEAWSAAPSP